MIFVRYAPSTYDAIDQIRQANQDREQSKARASDNAKRDTGPKYSG